MSDKKNIHQRILGVMEDVEYIQKCDKKVNGQYRFVSHDQVSGALHPHLVKHGICVIPICAEMKQDGNRTTVTMIVSFVNADNPEDCVKIQTYGCGIDPGDKGIGKATSYAYKYALLKLFCLETGEDPDQDPTATYVAEPQSKKEFDGESPPTPYQLIYFQKELVRLGKTDKEFFEDIGLSDGWNSVKQKDMAEMLLWAKDKYETNPNSF